MDKSKIETLTISVKEQYIKLTRDDIIDYLKRHGITIYNNSEVKVEFKVPSGGNWSGQRIEITKEDPILVTIKSTEKK